MRAMLFATPDDLSSAEVDDFWKQGICMDDWDYMVLCENPDSLLEPDNEAESDDERGPSYRCLDWSVERLLCADYRSRWYRGTYQGKLYAVGVVYHA